MHVDRKYLRKICIFIYLLQFTQPARSGQISCLHGNLTDQQDVVNACL